MTPVNDAPVAVADTADAQAGTPVTIAVLANDSDVDGDAVTIGTVGLAGHGTTAISGNNVVYTAAAGYAGTDSFTYTVKDTTGATSSATVSVSVTSVNLDVAPVNDAPQVVTVLQNDFESGFFYGFGGGVQSVYSPWFNSSSIIEVTDSTVLPGAPSTTWVVNPSLDTFYNYGARSDLSTYIPANAGDEITVSFDYAPVYGAELYSGLQVISGRRGRRRHFP